MKPKIICHMMSSVDGRLITDRYSDPFDGKTNDDMTSSYFTISDQLEGEAIIIGRATVQEYFLPNSFDHQGEPPTLQREAYHGKRGRAKTTIVINPK